MPTEIFDDPFSPVNHGATQDSLAEKLIFISSCDFQLIQRKLDDAEANMNRALKEQAAHFRNKISDLRTDMFDDHRMIKTYEQENAALWLENLKLKEKVKQLTVSVSECEGPPF